MTLWQDVRYGLRMLARTPGFTAIVILILAVGIGANTAVFSVVDTVVLKVLPFEAPRRIVQIRETEKGAMRWSRPILPRTLAHWREHNEVFEHVAGMVYQGMCVTWAKESFEVSVKAVSSCFFSLVGTQPELGRGFLPDEEQPGHNRVMVMSHAFWQNRMGGDPEVIGKSIIADGQGYTVVGVMPPGYDSRFESHHDVWVPLVLDSVGEDDSIDVWARLKRGVTMERARSDMGVLQQQLAQADPRTYGRLNVSVDRLWDLWLGSQRKLLYPLWGAVGFVLLIACVNVVGLLLMHGDARRQEMGVRMTLGASRGRILVQLLTENLLLSLAGGLLGVLAAFWMIRGIVAVCPADVYHIDETCIDKRVLAFALGLSMIVGLAFGLLPAWKAGGSRLFGTQRGESSRAVMDRPWRRLCGALVVSQIAVAMTLLVGVGMLVQTLIRMQNADLGFRPKGVLVAHIELPAAKYPLGRQAAECIKQLLQRLQALPGVRSAAWTCPELRLGSGGMFGDLVVDGGSPNPEERTDVRVRIVSDDFFAALGMRILRGRGFTQQDAPGAEKAVVIEESLARRFFPGQYPIGRRIGIKNDPNVAYVVGVVSSLRDYTTLTADVIGVYWPLSARAEPYGDIVVKFDGDPLQLGPAIRAQAVNLDEDLKITSIQSIEEILYPLLSTHRFAVALLGAFAQIALAVAVLGLYGLLQYGVSRRTHEIGVRMALGATRERIVWTVLRQGGLLIVTGIGLGLLGGYAMSRIVASLLYESKPTDPAMLAIVLLTLLGTAFAACYVPARRAAKVDPMVALRCE